MEWVLVSVLVSDVYDGDSRNSGEVVVVVVKHRVASKDRCFTSE